MAPQRRPALAEGLSETAFVLPSARPEADYRLRIFTPGGELPFAGLPTLGSAHAWLERGDSPQAPGCVVQECEAGLVQVRRRTGQLAGQWSGWRRRRRARPGTRPVPNPRRDGRRYRHALPRRCLGLGNYGPRGRAA
ncbi:MAG TPA: PhzF family phenazine biosynthesis protein [Streptosporangiaceae bacterium]